LSREQLEAENAEKERGLLGGKKKRLGGSLGFGCEIWEILDEE